MSKGSRAKNSRCYFACLNILEADRCFRSAGNIDAAVRMVDRRPLI